MRKFIAPAFAAVFCNVIAVVLLAAATSRVEMVSATSTSRCCVAPAILDGAA